MLSHDSFFEREDGERMISGEGIEIQKIQYLQGCHVSHPLHPIALFYNQEDPNPPSLSPTPSTNHQEYNILIVET